MRFDLILRLLDEERFLRELVHVELDTRGGRHLDPVERAASEERPEPLRAPVDTNRTHNRTQIEHKSSTNRARAEHESKTQVDSLAREEQRKFRREITVKRHARVKGGGTISIEAAVVWNAERAARLDLRDGEERVDRVLVLGSHHHAPPHNLSREREVMKTGVNKR